ncbi:MAG: hypothetical protein AAFQ36_09105 [Pseudomonadota bacterium]
MDGETQAALTIWQKIDLFDAWLRTPQGVQFMVMFAVTLLAIILIGRIVMERILEKDTKVTIGTETSETEEKTDFRALRKERGDAVTGPGA